MAIKECLQVSRVLHGDGEDKAITIDFADEITLSKICAGAPDEVKCSSTSGAVKATLSGSKVTFEFAEAPSGVFTVAAELFFGPAPAPKKQTPVEHKPAHHEPEHAHKKH